jgi:hypothetical protein
MKTTNLIRTIFLSLLFIGISGIASYAIQPELAPAVHLQKVIKENIKYPEQAVKHCCTGDVTVTFKLDADGKIIIKKIEGENDEIIKGVKDQLASICCKDVKVPFNQTYKVTITFKLV